jgi:hypothetical protein
MLILALAKFLHFYQLQNSLQLVTWYLHDLLCPLALHAQIGKTVSALKSSASQMFPK